MAPRKYTLNTTHTHQNKRLDQVLAEWLPQAIAQPLSKSKVRMLVMAGAVYLNGKRVRIASKPVLANARIDVYVDLQKLKADSASREKPFVLTADRILYEDDYLIAVDKPPGLPTQPTLDEARINLFAAAKKFLAERDGNPQAYVGLHHRLDRDTSGVILFTKKAEANAGVADLFSKHLATKTYNAITIKPRKLPESEWLVKNYLGRLKTAGKKAVYGAVRAGGDFAHTDFRLLEALGDRLWVEARPRTGRTHQIRVHLSEAGMPILGDSTYGGPGELGSHKIPRLMLHAVSLTFPHPILKNEVTISSPLPKDFTSCLGRQPNSSGTTSGNTESM